MALYTFGRVADVRTHPLATPSNTTNPTTMIKAIDAHVKTNMSNTHTNLSGQTYNIFDWKEMVALEYVLIWNYTKHYNRDLSRYLYLTSQYTHP